ncbi:MAG TPA: GMC family oxidoreductase [Acidimicrobiales bacterium]|nr:GMC family oxidoreductase [Acidimicrobiales bacterium]
MAVETADVVVIGSGFGGAIPAYHLAAGGARVIILERGPRLATEDFTHDLQLGTYTRIVDLIRGTGVDVVAGNCVGGSSVVYFAASLRAPSFVFERQGSLGRRLWPEAIDRSRLDPFYDIVEETLPVAEQPWDEVSYAGGVWAAACDRAGHTCNPVPLAVDLDACTSCNWMLNGCRFGAKRSMLLNYLPAAEAHGAEVRPLHEVQAIGRAVTAGYRYSISYTQVDGDDHRVPAGAGVIDAKVVVLAAGAMGTPVILQRSAPLLGGVPDAVGKHFSPNGDRVSLALLDEDRVRDLLHLRRGPEVAYEGYPIGKPIGSMTFDHLDPSLPEFDRFSLQQIYFPTITNLLPADGAPGDPNWFGIDKRDVTSRWRSWLTVLAMTEDDNEGTFGPPPATGNFTRIASAASLGQTTYRPNARTQRGWDRSDQAIRSVIERDGLGQHLLWEQTENALSAHPLSSCRIGDDPATSALDHRHELRGHPGVFVTDGAAVPTSLCVNPSLTIAALAERASRLLVARDDLGLAVTSGAPPPGNESGGPPPRPGRRGGRITVLPATGGDAALGGAVALAAAGLGAHAAGRRRNHPLVADRPDVVDAGGADQEGAP